MKTRSVTVRFVHGLHARPAATLVKLLARFRARVLLRAGNRMANAGSFLSILLLAASFNTRIEIQASGEDEEAALAAAETFFQTENEEKAEDLHSRFST